MKMKLSKSILRNGAAHSFFAARKNRGGGAAASENPEPSSPKVTCIGQVRVKSKRKLLSKQQTRSLSRRRSAGEISFRKTEQSPRHRHQRWVHLPISALSEFTTCVLFPCCAKTGCCPVPARWLVCGGGRRAEAAAGGGDAEEEEEVMFVGSLRRHVFEDYEVKNGWIEVKGRRLEVEEDQGIPPKNALFLMRCGSDPMKMATLMNRRSNWNDVDDDDDIIQEQDEEIERVHVEKEEIEEIAVSVKLLETSNCDDDEDKLLINTSTEEEGEEVESNMSSFEALLDQEIATERNDVVSREETEDYEEETEEEKKNEESLQLPECLLLMMCEPKLSMEVSKETWVRTTDFVRWLPERPRKAAAACEHQPVVKRRPSVDSKPPRPMMKNDHRLQPPRSSCSLPAAAAVNERKMQGSAYEPLELTRCKSEPMRTAAAKLLPEFGGVHALSEAGVGF